MRVCSLLAGLAATALLLAAALPAHAVTYVNRSYWTDTDGHVHYNIVDVTIGANAVWNTAGSPYVCEGNVSTSAGTTLTVQSGVTVSFGANTGLYINGTLNATNVAFGTLGGHWKGIYLSPNSGGSSLSGCTIDNAGAFNNGYGLGYWHGDNRQFAIYVDTCNPIITGCTISNAETHGMALWSSKATIQNNTFQNTPSGYYAMVYQTTDCFPTISGNVSTGPGYNGIALPGGEITVNGAWNRPGVDFPYYAGGETSLNAANTLTIDPGVTIKNSYTRFLINGTLLCNGTSALPVTFTSRAATPGPGDWRGIYFAPTAGASNLNYTNLFFGGAFDNGYGLGYWHGVQQLATVFVDACNPTFSNFTMRTSQMHGLDLFNCNSSISNAAFDGIGYRALILSSNSRPTIATAAFTNNTASGNYVVGMDASCVPTISGTTFSTNKYQGVEIWGGTLPSSGTWQNWSNNAPYVITADTTVAAGATLTIEQGTGLQAWRSALLVNGTLLGDGTPNRIRFTSAADDSLFGDINGNGSASTPAPGDWRGIYLSPASGSSILRNTEMGYSGAFNNGYGLVYLHNDYQRNALYVDTCNPTITGCTISNSETQGLVLYSSKATIQNNTFQNTPSGYYAMVYQTTDCFPAISGNVSSGAGYNGIALPGGEITVNGTWNRPGVDFPYYAGGETSLNAANTLTIDPGVTIKNSYTRFLINGTLLCNGTSALPVTFTSRAATPAPGDWRGIYFAPTAGSSNLKYTSLFFGGAYDNGSGLGYWRGAYQLVTVFVDACNPTFSNFTMRTSQMHGLDLFSCNSSISNAAFDGIGYRALILSSNSRPTIATAAFTNNTASGNYVVGMDASCVPTISGTTFSNNKYQGVEIWGGTLPSSGTWQNWSNNAPYVITADTTVAAGATLTIEQGTGLQASGSGLFVNGTLLCDGTPNRIRFTSAADDSLFGDINGDGDASSPAPGNWRGIYLSPASGSSILRNTDIGYSGAYHNGYGLAYWHGGYQQNALYVDTCNPKITGCTVSNSETHGLVMWSSNATIQNNTFQNTPSGYYAVVYESTDCFPTISGNVSTGAGYNGIAWPGGQIAADGTWNRPGADFPYYINGPLTLNAGNTLNLDPGVAVKASGGVGLYINGALKCNGTATLPVTFTSRAIPPAAGQWLGMYLGPTAGASILKFTSVLNSGAFNNGYGLGYWHGGYQQVALAVDGCSPDIDGLTLRNSETQGLQLWGTTAKVNSALITDCGSWAIQAAGDGAGLTNITIVKSGGGMVSYGSGTLANSIIANCNYGYLQQTGVSTTVYDDIYACNLNNNYPGGTGNMQVDPSFVNAATGDYHLQATSPLLNKGYFGYVTGQYDLDGNARVQGIAPDMGAYEYGVANAFTPADVATALRIAGGLSTSVRTDLARLDLVVSTPARIDLNDCVKIARKAAGLEANP